MARRIVLVDDDVAIRRAVARLLQAHSYEVRTFSSAGDLLNSLDHEIPDCLIVDLAMDGMTGLELLRHLSRTGLKIPAIVCTAHDGARRRCELAGARAFLTKPVDGHSLLEAIEAAISAAELR